MVRCIRAACVGVDQSEGQTGADGRVREERGLFRGDLAGELVQAAARPCVYGDGGSDRARGELFGPGRNGQLEERWWWWWRSGDRWAAYR